MLLQPPVTQAKTVLDLQPFKKAVRIALTNNSDTKNPGFVRLTNLNPHINSWYLLEINFPSEDQLYQIHLENVFNNSTSVELDTKFPQGVILREGKQTTPCPLWAQNAQESFIVERWLKDKSAYIPICNQRLYIRKQLPGRESTKEWVADFLRSHVWGGEKITSLVKRFFYKDKFKISSKDERLSTTTPAANLIVPQAAQLQSGSTEIPAIVPKDLGIGIASGMVDGKILAGYWYPIKGPKHFYISAIKPKYVAQSILTSYPKRAKALDQIEADALVYLIAMDLDKIKLSFVMGTDHPAADWSDRVIDEIRQQYKDDPGPDGFDTFLPLQMTGQVPPHHRTHVKASFTAGFKRSHSAFKWGQLSKINKGSHYGFMEKGTLLSSLNPGLATLSINTKGHIALQTWEEQNNAQLDQLVDVRQNGVPIIEWDEENKQPRPGELVPLWGAGNWSGSTDSNLRALRAGLCLQKTEHKRYLIYAYFSSATPSTMARVFQAYHCQYAMHLDMNALEHTYFAIYTYEQNQLHVAHLIEGMKVLDRTINGTTIPRFIGVPDNRDFFYVY